MRCLCHYSRKPRGSSVCVSFTIRHHFNVFSLTYFFTFLVQPENRQNVPPSGGRQARGLHLPTQPDLVGRGLAAEGRSRSDPTTFCGKSQGIRHQEEVQRWKAREYLQCDLSFTLFPICRFLYVVMKCEMCRYSRFLICPSEMSSFY